MSVIKGVIRNWLCLVILLLGRRPRTRTLEKRQVRATTAAKLLLYPTGPIRRILRIRPPCRTRNQPETIDSLRVTRNWLCLVILLPRWFAASDDPCSMGPECFACTQLHYTLPIQAGPGTDGAKLLLMRHLGCMTCSPRFLPPDGRSTP